MCRMHVTQLDIPNRNRIHFEHYLYVEILETVFQLEILDILLHLIPNHYQYFIMILYWTIISK